MRAPRLLALSASATGASAALMDSNGECRQLDVAGTRGQAAQLLNSAQQLLSTADWRLADLNALVLACGPGPFTSLRVSAGVAQGLALGTDLPIVPVSSLATVAQGALRCELPLGVQCALVLCHARSGQWYRGAFSLNTATTSIAEMATDARCGTNTLALPETWAWPHCIGLGDGWRQPPTAVRRCLQVLPEARPEARDAVQLGALSLATNSEAAIAPELAVPNYLCGEEAWQPAPTPWLTDSSH